MSMSFMINEGLLRNTRQEYAAALRPSTKRVVAAFAATTCTLSAGLVAAGATAPHAGMWLFGATGSAWFALFAYYVMLLALSAAAIAAGFWVHERVMDHSVDAWYAVAKDWCSEKMSTMKLSATKNAIN